ncbi:MAG TPA: ABC transporter substrate-binding protein, partial [Thermoanaerobaculia bacterium]|nr:ABC transporter substrate-binding protein [Thermoanaerobaculia bacterium]
ITISGSAVGREREILSRQVARFMAANPGVTVRIQQTPDDATQRHQLYVQWLNARVGSPDVLQLDVIWTAELAAAGWILPLDRFAPDRGDFFPATIAANEWLGSLYALPWFVDVGMLFWRSDLVDRAPQSLEELNTSARRAMATHGIRNGVVWQGARYEGLVTVFAEYLGAFGGSILDRQGRVAVDSPAAVRALTFMRDQIRSGVAPREALTWHEEECRFAFQNGTAVFMRNWPYAVAPLSDATESRVAGRFAVAPMPGAEGGRATASLGGAQLAINAWSGNPDLAWRLIAFLTAPEAMLERAEVVGQYPPRMSLYSSPALAAALPVSPGDVRRIIAAATPRPVTPLYAELSGELQVGLHRALTGEAEPRRALADTAAKMRRIIDESGMAGAHR